MSFKPKRTSQQKFSKYEERRDSQEVSPEQVRKIKDRQKSRKEAQSPLSSEQEAALKSISVFLEENEPLFAQCQDWLFMRAHYIPELFYPDPEAKISRFAFSPQGRITCEQSSFRAFRYLAQNCLPPKDRLHRQGPKCLLFAGFEGEEVPQVGLVQPWEEGEFKPSYDVALILGTSSRAENYVNFFRAFKCVRPGGLIVFSIANSLGAGSFEKNLRTLLPLQAQLSRYHCRTFAIQVPDSQEELSQLNGAIEQWQESFAYVTCQESGLLSRPGIFSWNKLDGGSAFLAQYIREKADLQGVGADLGSANGALTKAVLESKAQERGLISRIDLFEDEYLALAAAKSQFKDKTGRVRLGFCWADVIEDVPREQYDWIVMNPPFHQGQTRVLNLGREFVASASRALTWRGTLYVVVNRTLPYEDTLKNYFEEFEKVVENNSFKVYKASKPIRID